MTEIQQFNQRWPRHKRERAAGELEGIDMLTHCLEHVLQIPLPHRSVIRSADLRKALRTRLCLPLVRF